MEDEMDESWVQTERPQRNITPRKTTRSPTPTFVMPPLDSDTLEASSADVSHRSPKGTPRKAAVRSRGPRRVSPSESDEVEPPIVYKKKKRPVPQSQTNTSEVLLSKVGTLFSHSLDILGYALKMLKLPISVAVAAFLLLQLGLLVRGYLMSSLYTSLSPICAIPGASMLGLPFCSGGSSYLSYSGGSVPPPEFDQLMMVQSKFEDVLKETAVGVTLPADMKRSEASIRDLRQLVRYSQLSSKNELGLEFDGFVDTARIASFDLQRFNSHIGRAVDHVLATTRWTTRVLDGLQLDQASRGSVNAFISDKILAPFQARQFNEVALLNQYIKHTQIVEDEIHKLISEAMALQMVLNNLEDRLDVIHGIVVRDNVQVVAKKEEILSELWTLVGGNRGKINRMTSQLSLLQQVGIYRHAANAHVGGTILKLQEISSGLEDLRERVGAPGNLRDSHEIPLSVHLENINRGVERLEESRDSNRKAEKATVERTLVEADADLAIDA